MIDLHLHTTASDGLLGPDALVDRIRQAGVTTFSVTDHDTVAGLGGAARAAEAHGLSFIHGIEITSIDDGRDLHLLGYGIDPASPSLATFLAAQRAQRVARVRLMLDRLDALGLRVDRTRVLEAADSGSGRAVGRPHLARALIAAGHVESVNEAFERWLGSGRPAFVPREGASPLEAIDHIHEAGGMVSLAHPAITRRDALVPMLVEHGLDAIEVWHSDHDAAATRHYAEMAEALGVLATGGSDFHGDGTGRACLLGRIPMAEDALDRVLERVASRQDAARRVRAQHSIAEAAT